MSNTVTLINDARLITNFCEAFKTRAVNVYDVALDGTGDLTVATVVNAAANPTGVLAVVGFTISAASAGVFKLQSGTTGTTTAQTMHMAANTTLHQGVKTICPYIHFMTNRTDNNGALVVAHSGAGAGANIVRARLWVVDVFPVEG